MHGKLKIQHVFLVLVIRLKYHLKQKKPCCRREILFFVWHVLKYYLQINMFLIRLNGESIGVSVFGIFVIDKNTILAVRLLLQIYNIHVSFGVFITIYGRLYKRVSTSAQ